MLHKFKLSFRRRLRRQRASVEAVAEQSGDSFERNFVQRLGKFGKVWRFLSGWTLLMVLLIACVLIQLQALGGYYQTRQPVAGGLYTGGILGTFTNANPIYATNEVDTAVSRLIFAGLFKYDNNNHLVGDLASDWSVNTAGTVYTVHLRKGLTWQDGQPLTSADVVFTYRVIQNPDAQSPLLSSWQGVAVAAKGPRTVTFTLPNPLTSFIYGMTNGIVPKHLLKNVPMVGMRSIAFNTQAPVGAGPFAWKDIDVTGTDASNAQESIGLTPFNKYWDGAPKLKSFVVQAFANQDAMIAAYNKHTLTAMSGLASLPKSVKPADSVVTSFPLTAANMVFFKTSAGPLADTAVRQALVLGSDPAQLMALLGYVTQPVREPLLIGQLGYDSQYAQKTGDPASATQVLTADGWLPGPGGIRFKNGQKLQFTLTIADQPEYDRDALLLQSQWRKLGVSVQINQADDASFRSDLAGHNYDAVLYGIAIGVDPDVFVYWDSSQADIRSTDRLNLSEYRSPVADDGLEAGRTRSDPALRIIKYSGFLKQWQTDAPALGLYQPHYLYISHVPIYGLTTHSLNESADRFYSVNNWEVRTARVTDNQN